MELNFGNASQGTATRAVMDTRVSAGNVAHTVDFFVSSQEIPGCDIILGTPFLTYAKAVVDHEGQAVVFPGNKRWHSLNVFPIAVSPDMETVPNIRLVPGGKRSGSFLTPPPQGRTSLSSYRG